MSFQKKVVLNVTEDGQFEILITDAFGTERTVLSRKESRTKADTLVKTQTDEAAPRG